MEENFAKQNVNDLCKQFIESLEWKVGDTVYEATRTSVKDYTITDIEIQTLACSTEIKTTVRITLNFQKNLIFSLENFNSWFSHSRIGAIEKAKVACFKDFEKLKEEVIKKYGNN